MAELVLRINNDAFLGNFELSMESGFIRYKTGGIWDIADIHQSSIKHLLLANWFSIEGYFPVIIAVLFEKIAPERALKLFKQAAADCQDDHKSKSYQLHRRNLGDSTDASLN